MGPASLKEQISGIPGDDGWWKESSEETYWALANELVEKGFTEDQAADILSAAYWAAASCYGD